jgi:hypothetical protein
MMEGTALVRRARVFLLPSALITVINNTITQKKDASITHDEVDRA